MNAKAKVVLIDDEERILRSLSMLLRPDYQVLATTEPQQVLDWVRGERIPLVVSDQRMPTMRGADLLREVRVLSPATMRVLLTGYSDLDSIVSSINEGEIFRFVSKPWDALELKRTVEQAVTIAQATAGLTPHAALPAPDDGTRPGVLVIDDDREVYEAVREILGTPTPAHFASSLEQAFERLAAHDIGVIVSELFVAGESMARALQLLKAEHPQVVSLVLTPFQDTGVIVGLINHGQVYRFLPKPVRRGPLGASIASALRHHRQLRATPALLHRHAVEQLRAPDDQNLGTRVMSYLSRLRGRREAALG